jgi:hypothetical protein
MLRPRQQDIVESDTDFSGPSKPLAVRVTKIACLSCGQIAEPDHPCGGELGWHNNSLRLLVRYADGMSWN